MKLENKIKCVLMDFENNSITLQRATKRILFLLDVMRSRFNKGDIVICWLKGGSYGDKFTVLEDTGGLTLLCHKTGGLCIVNNRDDYDFA